MKLNDEDLRELESAIALSPDGPPAMRGTGGLRKIRFASKRSGAGKSGGCRVCYAYFQEFGLVYLCAAFPKSAKANLTQAECNDYRRILEAFHRYLKDHFNKGWTP